MHRANARAVTGGAGFIIRAHHTYTERQTHPTHPYRQTDRQTPLRAGVRVLLPELGERHVLLRVLLHHLGHRHFKVLLRDVRAALSQRKHACLCTYGLRTRMTNVGSVGVLPLWCAWTVCVCVFGWVDKYLDLSSGAATQHIGDLLQVDAAHQVHAATVNLDNVQASLQYGIRPHHHHTTHRVR